ncbi:hypothetical protein GCM10009865_45620 [Aeromicrobium ponti]
MAIAFNTAPINTTNTFLVSNQTIVNPLNSLIISLPQNGQFQHNSLFFLADFYKLNSYSLKAGERECQ